ncbi:hypothetical protein Ae201684P_014347 [Aphanomyces euteiches]|uniref:DDE Tnp4 domain-containing protein n=1 Tax=Aphanomyces euteiches TaxID=100861 RepID=A0A6G0WYC1_9STRA|nr:hypothetical protein Ae201684_010288 [Aphanomyces euteiches]KAH9090549.1 hypothetical protein Ae201684P_014347 [Aphanomyces euteiches]
MTIEHCIGMIKSRFSRLRDGFFTIMRDTECHEMVIRMILACIMLHNICISKDDERNEEYDVDTPQIEVHGALEPDHDDDVWTPANEFQLEIQKHLVLRHFN